MRHVPSTFLTLITTLITTLWAALALPACGEPAAEAPMADAGLDGPALGYATPAGPRALLFELKGLINPYDHVLHQEHATLGSGSFRVLATGKQVELLDEDPLAYRYVYSKDAGALAGKRLLVLQAQRFDPATTAAVYRVGLAQVIVPWDTLAASLKEHAQGSPADGAPLELDARTAGLSASLRQATFVGRSDGVHLTRDCTVGLLDPGNAASRLRIGAMGGQAVLAEGRPLHVAGNLALEQDRTRLGTLLAGKGLELHQGQHCRCGMDDKQVACALYEAEAKKSGEELSCPLPAGFLTPGSGSSVALTFKGTINPEGSASPQAGLATHTATVDGKTYGLGYRTHALRYTFSSGAWAGQEIVELLSLGDVTTVAKGRYAFNALFTRVRADLLAAIKAAGTHSPPAGAQPAYLAFLLEAEQVYPENGDNLVKMCPVAVTPSDPGELYLCHAQNTSFAAGERLELAANLELTSDPQQIAAGLGLSAGTCFCTKNGAAMACSSFPAAGGTSP